MSLTVEEGEIFGLLGPNGAGKTTVLNTIQSLTKVDAGKIRIFGKDIKHGEQEIKQEMGIVPQDMAIYEDLTAYENAAFFGRLYGLRGSLLKEKVEEALNFTGLWEKKKEFPKKFSGGMKRRLNIACAIVHQPKLIIMDEPTVGIDPQSRNHILESVKELNRRGATILYTSHYMEEVEEICSRIAIMDNGRIIAKGTKEELKALISFEERITLEVSSVNHTLVDNIKQVSGVKDCIVKEKGLTIISQKESKNLSRIIESSK